MTAKILDKSGLFLRKYVCSKCGKELDSDNVEKCDCGAIFKENVVKKKLEEKIVKQKELTEVEKKVKNKLGRAFVTLFSAWVLQGLYVPSFWLVLIGLLILLSDIEAGVKMITVGAPFLVFGAGMHVFMVKTVLGEMRLPHFIADPILNAMNFQKRKPHDPNWLKKKKRNCEK